MYRVLLVDDEIWSLEGMRKLLEWERMGFTVIAQASDASEAGDVIARANPDVVFTDIRMPEISGIELMNMARKMGATSEFVVVSGFAEFEYAQEALRYGAFDYQLKPVDPEEAGKLLERLKQKLDEKQFVRNRQIYDQLVSGSGDPLEVLQANGFVPCGDHWQAAVIHGDFFRARSGETCPFRNGNPFILPLGKEKTVVLLNEALCPGKAVPHDLKRWAEQHHLLAGFSDVCTDAGRLPKLIREADMAAVSIPFIPLRSAVHFFDGNGNALIDSIAGKAEKWMMANNFTEISALLDRIPGLFQQENMGIYQAALLWNRMAVVIGKRRGSASVERIEFLDYEGIANRFRNLQALRDEIRETFRQICFAGEAGPARQPQYNDHFIALLEHVNRNFNKDLSLGELAGKFFLNMSYCSELFKKATGYTFTDYVTKLRMETAAELLQSGKYPADKVCYMTGYHDYYYFSKIFKKFHGVPPSHFAGKMAKRYV